MDEQGFTPVRSAIDASVNFARKHPLGGLVETRFVRRVEERFIVYLSTMNGCDKACRFCHLTQTGQTMSDLLSRDEILEQADTVLGASDFSGAHTVHFNFMARGEPLSNPAVGHELFAELGARAARYGLKSRMKVSTIFPLDMKASEPGELWQEGMPPVDLYYSLYSLDPVWRRRWLPKAADPQAAFEWLARFQRETGNRVILHWALIDGENDDASAGLSIAYAAKASGLKFDYNLVRYNPANGKSREATSGRMDRYVEAMRQGIGDSGRVKVIPRVGFDVAASCGMFLREAEDAAA